MSGYIITAHPGPGVPTPVRVGAFTAAELREHLNEFEADGYDLATITVEPDGAGDFACAECGTTTATTYVVTTLDAADPKGTRTEVCRSCDSQGSAVPAHVVDYADALARKILGDWVHTLGDGRSVSQMIAQGVREGYALGLGAGS